jgi:hypothetical protein
MAHRSNHAAKKMPAKRALAGAEGSATKGSATKGKEAVSRKSSNHAAKKMPAKRVPDGAERSATKGSATKGKVAVSRKSSIPKSAVQHKQPEPKSSSSIASSKRAAAAAPSSGMKKNKRVKVAVPQTKKAAAKKAVAKAVARVPPTARPGPTSGSYDLEAARADMKEMMDKWAEDPNIHWSDLRPAHWPQVGAVPPTSGNAGKSRSHQRQQF